MTVVDTNILVHACDQRQPHLQEIAQKLLRNTSDLVILWQVACEFIAASRKLQAQGFEPSRAREYLSALLEVFPLVLPTRAQFDRATLLMIENQVSFWDALTIAACLENGATCLYSADLPGQHIKGLEILNPFA